MTQILLHNRELAKYPRTPHLQGSRYQPGDKGDPVPLSALSGLTLVVEEKLDAANAGLSFDAAGQLWLQSRGHYLDLDRMGGRERQFNLFKQWARAHESRLLQVLEDRYVMYGEFMHATTSRELYCDKLSTGLFSRNTRIGYFDRLAPSCCR